MPVPATRFKDPLCVARCRAGCARCWLSAGKQGLWYVDGDPAPAKGMGPSGRVYRRCRGGKACGGCKTCTPRTVKLLKLVRRASSFE